MGLILDVLTCCLLGFVLAFLSFPCFPFCSVLLPFFRPSSTCHGQGGAYSKEQISNHKNKNHRVAIHHFPPYPPRTRSFPPSTPLRGWDSIIQYAGEKLEHKKSREDLYNEKRRETKNQHHPPISHLPSPPPSKSNQQNQATTPNPSPPSPIPPSLIPLLQQIHNATEVRSAIGFGRGMS